MSAGGIVVIALAFFVVVVVLRAVRIVPQARAGIVERLGRYARTLDPGLVLLIPFVDRLRPLIDLREQVVSFAPQPVITEDNLVVNIDTVIYYQVIDPRAATYEIANYIAAIEQLTVTTLRNVIGGITLERVVIRPVERVGVLPVVVVTIGLVFVLPFAAARGRAGASIAGALTGAGLAAIVIHGISSDIQTITAAITFAAGLLLSGIALTKR